MSRAARLQALWAELNVQHWDGRLKPVPILLRRSRRTYGYFHGPNPRGQGSITISTVMADTPELVRETMLHEMVHQALYQWGYPNWDEHGAAFQIGHEKVFGEFYVEPA